MLQKQRYFGAMCFFWRSQASVRVQMQAELHGRIALQGWAWMDLARFHPVCGEVLCQ